METLTALAGGFAVALTPQNLLWALAGVTLGTAVGVLPGIGPALTVALLLPITYSLDPSLYVGNVMLLILNLPLVGVWVRLLSIPQPALNGGILILASAGAYSVNRSVFDIGLLYAIGGVGYLMRRRSIPLAPAIIGLILGPMAEQQLRRALAIAEGSPAVLVTRPISATLLAAAVVLLCGPLIVRLWRRLPRAPGL